jgi:hypothetical protein
LKLANGGADDYRFFSRAEKGATRLRRIDRWRRICHQAAAAPSTAASAAGGALVPWFPGPIALQESPLEVSLHGGGAGGGKRSIQL